MSHSFVFKIKHSTSTTRKDETRRYGFTGDLFQQQVFTGLYDRTSSVFGLTPGKFTLDFASSPDGVVRSLDTYDAFKHNCANKVLSPHNLLTQKLDEKGRIVLVFNVVDSSTTQEQEQEDLSGTTPKQDDIDFDKWQRETAEALARSSHEEHTTSPPTPPTHQVDEEQVPATAPTVAPSSSEALASATPTPVPSTNFLDSSTGEVNPPFVWNWSAPPHHHSNSSFASASRDGSEHRREQQVNAFSSSSQTSASNSNSNSNSNSTSGYNPHYSLPAPPSEVIDEPVSSTSISSSSSSSEETWSGVKALLRNFVVDLNRHLADNFGDEAAGFELSIPSSSKAEEEKPQKEQEEKVKHVHSSCFCDRCLKTIIGTRHKCQQCNNYDLCDSCVDQRSRFHADDHVFGRIEKPGDSPVLPSPVKVEEPVTVTVPVPVTAEEGEKEEKKEHPAFCDLCDKSIRGVRHKCVNCPDFDVCEACWLAVDDLHPHHNFVPIHDPSLVKIRAQPGDRAVHRNISCDGCGTQPIVGIRYKCTHDDCPNFDLCAACEAEPVPRHPRSHNLLKIREPVRGFSGRAAVTRAVHQASEAAAIAQGVDAVVSNQSPPTQLSSGFATLLQSIRTAVPAAFADASAAASSPCTAEIVQKEGDKTLVIDLDIDPRTLGVPSVIHVPIQLPAEVPEKVVTSPVVASVGGAYNVEEEQQEKEVKVEEKIVAPVPSLPALSARFVSDVTLEDRSVVPAGSLFTKIWRVQNSGSSTWPVGTHLVNVGGFSRFAPNAGGVILSKEVPLAAPGEVVELQVDLQAPEDDGRHLDHWRLSTVEDERFGDRIWIDITVESDEERLRESGSSLSSSIVAPSMNANGFNGAPPSESASQPSVADTSSAASEFDHVSDDDEDEVSSEEESSSDEDGSERSSSSSDEDDFVVLSGTDPNDSEDDSEWNA